MLQSWHSMKSHLSQALCQTSSAHLPDFSQSCLAGTSRQNTNESKLVWNQVFQLHFMKELQGIFASAVLRVCRHHSIPGDYIPVRHCVEGPPCILGAATLAIHID
eukprot:c29105_g10_i1 orf=1-312(-)